MASETKIYTKKFYNFHVLPKFGDAPCKTVYVQFTKKCPSDQAMIDFLKLITEVFHDQEQFQMLFTTSMMEGRPTLSQIKIIQKWVKHHKILSQKYLKRTCICISYTPFRILLNMILLLKLDNVSPIKLCATAKEGCRYLELDLSKMKFPKTKKPKRKKHKPVPRQLE